MQQLEEDLTTGIKHNKRSIEKIGANHGITSKTEIKELTELAIVISARKIAHSSGLSVSEKYQRIVELYKNQINLSHRTSQSILLQQYSTPAPIAFMAGIFVNADDPSVSVFEPSAGNGLLTIVGDPQNVIANEIDDLRGSNLMEQGYRQVLNQDATQPFKGFEKKFDAVLTNPPFGKHEEVRYETFPIKTLEHLMALRALDTMKDTGKAAIIIGGHNRYDKKGRFQKGNWRFFFNYLYSHYNVVDLINISGRNLFSRQGTSFNVRLILINGRKITPSGAAPMADDKRDKVVDSFDELYERVIAQTENRTKSIPTIQNSSNMKSRLELEAEALALELELLNTDSYRDDDELGIPYIPASDSCTILDTVVPDSMGYETHSAIFKIKEEVGGDIDEYVRKKLNYKSKIELCKALSAEQIDAVALAIYNIEERGQGMIIGDQTGIGKGRIAASVIRYGVEQGVKPVFITEKANLFSDIYRDLVAIGSANLVPFIVNSRESKTDIKDEDGNVVYQALPGADQERIFEEQKVPRNFDFVCATYSQFNSPEKKPTKPRFLMAIAQDNILIMDEAHNSSGSGNTGNLFQGVLAGTRGVVFLSATFAKRPDNMPIYAMKTAISEASMTRDDLVDAVLRGGVALQEILASQLVAEGQMIRRERSFEGVEVNYITLEDKEQEHKAISDNITDIIRYIIGFQKNHIDKVVEELDKIAIAEGKQVELREGTSQAGVDNLPYFSKVFNVINQMLFSVKAEAVAERAIMRLKEGKKVVVAFASTMGSFIEQMENNKGLSVSDGDVINADFSTVLQRGLDGVMRYTVTEPDGQTIHKTFDVSELDTAARSEYEHVSEKIQTIGTGITISPIDVIIQRIEEAGYTVAEVTGRKYRVQLGSSKSKESNRSSDQSQLTGLVLSRKRENTNDAFRRFNNNEVDVLLINQSGSTGASAHAIVTPKVPKEKVKQRVMIVLQPELDISTEVQKRGRINRTGQIYKPIYDYVNSAIPAEQRLMMMLQKKLKSLDANTTSNQKSSTKILDVPDFLNKYGDHLVTEYLSENPLINDLLDDPLHLNNPEADSVVENAAHKVSGRVAVLSTKMQQDFYTEISNRYNEYVEYLKQTGEYDLEVEAMDLQAETINRQVVIVGKGGKSTFGDDSILETIHANVLRKPFTTTELGNLMTEALQGKDARMQQQEIIKDYEAFVAEKLERELDENDEHYEGLIKGVPEEKKLQKILTTQGQNTYMEAIKQRKAELQQAQQESETRIRKNFANRQEYMMSMFDFFYVGRNLNYPVTNYDEGQVNVSAIFLGFIIDRKKDNPYAPSNVRLRFAIAGSNKYIAIPGSYNKDITAIKGASVGVPEKAKEETLTYWENEIKANTVNRKARHVVTDNLLQAFGSFKGKLVSYTTLDGGVKKGILMPESWAPPKVEQQKVSVPISRARKVIRSLNTSGQIVTSNNVSIFKQPEGYKIIVSSSRQRAGDVFLEEDILKLVKGHNFEKVSDKMVAVLDEKDIDRFIEILQDKFNAGVTLTMAQFNMIKGELPPHPLREERKVAIPPPRKREESDEATIQLPDSLSTLELEAMALELELELLEFGDS